MSVGKRGDYLKDAIDIAADAFEVGNYTPEFENDVFNHLVDHVTGFVSIDGEPAAFGSVQLLQSTVGNIMYIGGMVVKQRYQHYGVGKELARTLNETFSAQAVSINYIAGRTQNPVVARARRAYCDPVYPIDHEPDESTLAVADKLQKHLNMTNEFVPSLLLSRDVYQRPMIRKPCGDPKIDGFFEQHVGPRDAIFIIGRPRT